MAKLQGISLLGDQARLSFPTFEVTMDRSDLHLLEYYTLYFLKNKTTSYVEARHKKTQRSTRLARLLLRPEKSLVVDHIDGNPLNNTRSNLRVVSAKANNQNRAKTGKACTSRFKGVSRKGSRWFACLYVDYRQVALGVFDTEEAAAHAYDTAARLRFADCAALNFPAVGEQCAHRPRTISFHNPEVSQ